MLVARCVEMIRLPPSSALTHADGDRFLAGRAAPDPVDLASPLEISFSNVGQIGGDAKAIAAVAALAVNRVLSFSLLPEGGLFASCRPDAGSETMRTS